MDREKELEMYHPKMEHRTVELDLEAVLRGELPEGPPEDEVYDIPDFSSWDKHTRMLVLRQSERAMKAKIGTLYPSF